MDELIKKTLEQYIADIDKLKKSRSTTQNEIWSAHVKEFLNKLAISQSDLVYFDSLSNSMRYATSGVSSFDDQRYDTMKLFLELLTRKNLSYTIKSDPAIRALFSSFENKKSIPLLSSTMNTRIKSQQIEKTSNSTKSNKIFLVHGHDDGAKAILSDMLKEMGFEPIILHEKSNQGKTIIEKLEKYSKDVSFAFVLLTPDDIGGKYDKDLNKRARQNVILELGYFYGLLGRKNVCCLYKSDVELPSDMHGIVYLPFEKSPEECYRQILRELKGAGLEPKS